MIEESQRRAARVLGVTYPLTFLILGVAFFRCYAPLLVWNDMAQTARNVFAHESTFRLYIVSALIYGLGLLVLLTALYVILQSMSRGLALFAACCRLVYAFLWFGMLLNLFSVLRVMRSASHLQSLDAERLPALAGLQLASGWDAYYIGLGFYGLGSLVFSCLWFKSRYIPRALAGWGLLASSFVTFCAFAYLIFPGFGSVVSVNWYEMPIGLFELVTSLWVLIAGLRTADPQK